MRSIAYPIPSQTCNQYVRPAILRTTLRPRSSKPFTTTLPTRTPDLNPPRSNPHRAYYRTHGRALFKCLTLAFLTYQTVYWTWLLLETEEIKDRKNREIEGLQGEVRLLQEERRGQLTEGRGTEGPSKEK